MSISIFFKIQCAIFCSSAFYRFSNFTRSNRFLCSLFFSNWSRSFT